VLVFSTWKAPFRNRLPTALRHNVCPIGQGRRHNPLLLRMPGCHFGHLPLDRLHQLAMKQQMRAAPSRGRSLGRRVSRVARGAKGGAIARKATSVLMPRRFLFSALGKFVAFRQWPNRRGCPGRRAGGRCRCRVGQAREASAGPPLPVRLVGWSACGGLARHGPTTDALKASSMRRLESSTSAG